MKFWDFPDISYFHNILSLKSFGNSQGNSFIPCLLLIIKPCFTCSERKFGQTSEVSKYHGHDCGTSSNIFDGFILWK